MERAPLARPTLSMWQHKPLRGGSPGPLLHHGTFHHSITPSLRAAGFEDEDDDEDENEAPCERYPKLEIERACALAKRKV
jgi:hypothetical protein